MSWIERHADSERLASQAQVAGRKGRQQEALDLYAQAADAENQAIAELDTTKSRTLGISLVSAASLYFKAARFDFAEAVAVRGLSLSDLPAFAKEQLRTLLQSIWTERARNGAGTEYARRPILVSIQGGEVLSGGAPLDLVMDKVKTIQSLLYRVAEFLSEREHRRRGVPTPDIQNGYRPWLYQSVPGSYQFAVAIQEGIQQELFRRAPSPEQVSSTFLRILRLEIEDPEEALAAAVPDAEYRITFLKLTRNLAPDGRSCTRLDIRPVDDPLPISLGPGVRRNLGSIIRRNGRTNEATDSRIESLRGMLRAVHLDKDWLELSVGSKRVRVHDVGEEVDDVIGPLVNRPVTVHVSIVDEKRKFLDIEPAESGPG